jgi:hypothetical protein
VRIAGVAHGESPIRNLAGAFQALDERLGGGIAAGAPQTLDQHLGVDEPLELEGRRRRVAGPLARELQVLGDQRRGAVAQRRHDLAKHDPMRVLLELAVDHVQAGHGEPIERGPRTGLPHGFDEVGEGGAPGTQDDGLGFGLERFPRGGVEVGLLGVDFDFRDEGHLLHLAGFPQFLEQGPAERVVLVEDRHPREPCLLQLREDVPHFGRIARAHVEHQPVEAPAEGGRAGDGPEQHGLRLLQQRQDGRGVRRAGVVEDEEGGLVDQFARVVHGALDVEAVVQRRVDDLASGHAARRVHGVEVQARTGVVVLGLRPERAAQRRRSADADFSGRDAAVRGMCGASQQGERKNG